MRAPADHSRPSSHVSGYLVALVATGIAVLLRLVMVAILGDQAPFFPFVLAVLAAAGYGGLKPGLLATGLGAGLGFYLFGDAFSSWPGSSRRALITTLFLTVGLTASLLCGALHAARRRTEEKQRRLEQAEEQARSVVNHIIDGIITIDESGMVQSINPAAERLFGYSADEVIGKNVKLLMPEPYNAEHDNYLANYLRTGVAKIIGVGREVAGRRKDGSIFPMDLAVSEYRLGERRCFTGIVRDITQLKNAEHALKEADRRKNEFLVTLAHELRNPLAPIRTAIEILRRAKGQDELREQACGLVERQFGLMVRLIDDLLDVSRIGRGKLQLCKEHVELASVIGQAVEAARPAIEAQGHELTVTLPPQPVPLDADPARLAQVFVNLLTNAAKYTEQGGRIWLSAVPQGGQVVVSVRDTGIGIAAEHLPHLFEMFSQVVSSLERSQGGLGIGLSLVRGLVELHGGSVEARSAGPGKGSEFLVRLPVAGARAAPPVAPPGAAEQPAGRRILVVDDNPDAADSLALLLRVVGHDVRTAYDGLAALATAEDFQPDVVLLDIGLPKMNGYEVARRLRQQSGPKNALLIAVTGYSHEEDRRRAEQSGFDRYLVKPIEPAALEQLLARAPTERG